MIGNMAMTKNEENNAMSLFVPAGVQTFYPLFPSGLYYGDMVFTSGSPNAIVAQSSIGMVKGSKHPRLTSITCFWDPELVTFATTETEAGHDIRDGR